jgi:hypothetical protein
MPEDAPPDTDWDTTEDIEFDTENSATGTAGNFQAEDYRQEIYAISSTGNVIIARTATGVHLLGADCIFPGLTIAY